MIKTIFLVLAVLSMIVLSFIGYKWFKIKNSKNYAEMIDQLVPNDIPYIYEDQIKELSSATILDVRSESEFKVSHLEHAIHIDYEGWNLESVKSTSVLRLFRSCSNSEYEEKDSSTPQDVNFYKKPINRNAIKSF